MGLTPQQRLLAAAKAVIADNSGDYETPTRSGCYVISMDKLRELKLAIEATEHRTPEILQPYIERTDKLTVTTNQERHNLK